MTTATPKLQKGAVAEALATVNELETGIHAFDLGQYKKAIEILKNSEIESAYLKIPPRLTPKVIEALQVAQPAYRKHFHAVKTTRIIAGILRINRKLSHFAQNETWADEMHVAAVLCQFRVSGFFGYKFFQSLLKGTGIKEESFNLIREFLFGIPVMRKLTFKKNGDIGKWKLDVYAFLEKLATSPEASKLIFCAIEFNTLYHLKRELEKMNKDIWDDSFLPRAEQLWYYGKIVDIMNESPPEEGLSEMLREFRSVSMDIFRMGEEEKSQPVSVPHP
ncbi:MAG TPA: hypothetical protein VIH31_01870 [Candidatus Paceibacterota bacterium]